MNCIIVDDEPLARKGIEMLISKLTDIEIMDSFSHALEALTYMENHQVDMIFLDIHMPGINGIEFAHRIFDKTLIIFTTAYSEYAIDSYDVDAIGYLIKPIDEEKFKKVVHKAQSYHSLLIESGRKAIEVVSKDYIIIKSDRRYHRLKLDDILLIEGLKDYIILHLAEQRIITRMTMKGIFDELLVHGFIRVNRSFIVNKNHIDSFDNNDIFIGKHEVSIGEKYRNDFFDHMLGNGH